MAELVFGSIALAGLSLAEGMLLTLRQLEWMLVARERREWDRFAQLMALVDARTAYGDECKPKSAAEYFPGELETDDERRKLWNRKNQPAPTVTADQLFSRMGL